MTDITRYDYYVTNSSLYDTEWKKASGDVFCSGTSTCTVTKLSGTQTCQTRTDQVSIGIGLHSPEIPNWPRVQLGVEYTISLSKENCFTASDQTACAWTDQACHTVFTSQQMLKQLGYRRQRCNWGNGDETECMADTEIDTPTQRRSEQCGAQCGKDEMVLLPTSTSSATPVTTTQSSTTIQSTSTTATLTLILSPSTISTTSSTTSSSATSQVPATVTLDSASHTSSPALPLASTNSASTLSTGAKAGIGLGTVALVASVFAFGLWFVRTRRDGPASNSIREMPPVYTPKY